MPIVVPSTTREYFVLYIAGSAPDGRADQPVAVIRGEPGTTELADDLPGVCFINSNEHRFHGTFMRANGLHERVDELLQNEQFRTDFDVQQSELSSLRDAIRDAPTPSWITDALATMHGAFPEGTSLGYRSSTNNENLVGFSGAGLYTSKTQHPDEEPLSKSLKQVYASLWTFRAFAIEIEFKITSDNVLAVLPARPLQPVS